MKISVIGMGAVGTAIVGSLVHMAEVHEIVAVNRNRERAAGEITDFRHVVAFPYAHNPRLSLGDYADIAGSGIVVIAAGAQPARSGSREDVMIANCDMILHVIGRLNRAAWIGPGPFAGGGSDRLYGTNVPKPVQHSDANMQEELDLVWNSPLGVG
jgi:malate/lactate dehydrogenase